MYLLKKLVENYYKWKDLETLYQRDLQFYQGKISEMEQQFLDLQRSGATPEELQQNYQQIQARINQYDQALQIEYQQKMNQITNEVALKISQYAKDNGYDLILNEIGVIYFNPKWDITNDIIEYLNNEENKTN
ncbi:outer membrane chaperone Skp [Petrotoga sp. 9PW.55.5.1]|nr:outer membrane chaperone Skp [Petrotoga sp. 9PW.55.5.1]